MSKLITFARSTPIVHPSGESLRTPLLVPSFSSKGFGFSKNNSGKLISEADSIFKVASEWLNKTMLVSAFDLAKKNVTLSKQSPVQLTFVDSGGYEVSSFQDISATYHMPSSTTP